MKQKQSKELSNPKEKTKKRVKFAGLILLAAAILAATIAVIPWLWRIGSAESEEGKATLAAIKQYTNDIGFWKYPLMLFLQILQIVVAIIPGGPMQILMGFIFDKGMGLLLSLLGIVIATWIIIWGVRKWGMKFARLFVGEEQLEKLSHFGSSRKRKTLLFILFLVPGTPKDVFTYFAPFLDMKPLVLTVIVTVARLPALICSVYIGDSLADGNFITSIIIFAVSAVLGIGGILLYEGITERREKKKEQENDLLEGESK